MDAATVGVAQKEDQEEGIDEQDIFYGVVLFLAALSCGLFSRVLGGLCRKVGFGRQNPKIGYWKINALRPTLSSPYPGEIRYIWHTFCPKSWRIFLLRSVRPSRSVSTCPCIDKVTRLMPSKS